MGVVNGEETQYNDNDAMNWRSINTSDYDKKSDVTVINLDLDTIQQKKVPEEL